ncbi:NUDIX domain-containing protein [Demequina sp.]|uniref:NUDIX domain-containing protein n=1 Tax=Demequina sp. TaxID=2050685 RepID=UPI003D0F9D96
MAKKKSGHPAPAQPEMGHPAAAEQIAGPTGVTEPVVPVEVAEVETVVGEERVEPEGDETAEPEPASGERTYVPFADQPGGRKVLHSRRSFTGRVWDVTSDLVDLGDSEVVTRDYMHHPGAVAVMALNEDDQVYLVRQYRHPVRTETWEPPAGLMDVRGEDPLDAAKRELFEEADLTAARWDVLVDYFTSAGGSSEGIRVYLARELAHVEEDDRHERTDEERDMVGAWVDVPSIINAITRGDVASSSLLMGAFALDIAIRADFATLRPADAPWRRPPARGEH